MKKALMIKPLESTVFYALDRAIKTYRQFAQRNIREEAPDITIDQWLLLKTIRDHPDLPQREMADRVFKDYASVTRMIELMVRRGYLNRTEHPDDRRRHELTLTGLGEQIYERLVPVVRSNREQALTGFSEKESEILRRLLDRLTTNCEENE